MRRFSVSTRRTGLLRVIKVEVYDTREELAAVYERLWRQVGAKVTDADLETVAASVVPRTDWEDRDPRPYQARMLLCAETLTATVMAHEAAHVAMHLYSMDNYRDHARASAHLHGSNEVVPYIIGDVFSAVAQRISDDSSEPIGIGWGAMMGDDALVPPRHGEPTGDRPARHARDARRFAGEPLGA